MLERKKDPIYSVLDETKIPSPYPFWNNSVARYFDVTLLSHYPCSFNCRESIKIAKERLQLIKKSVSSSLAEYIIEQLKSAIIVTKSKGIYKINNFLFEYNETYFKKRDIFCINKTYIWDILKRSTKIHIKSKKRLIFLKENKVLKEFKGRTIGIFIFQ